jgi:urea carboxylase
MEGPGGYQFVGRTVPVWNSWKTNADFQAGAPWLLRGFDRIRWYEVGAEELLDLRADVAAGRHRLRIEDGTLHLADRLRALDADVDDIAAFRRTQRAAFAAERERWRREGL